MICSRTAGHDGACAASPVASQASGQRAASDLQGLREVLLTPADHTRDDDGHLSHPAFPVCDEGTDTHALLAAFGLESAFVGMEGDCDDEILMEQVWDGGSCLPWVPTPPEGDGWLLIEIFPTEDGPHALFVRDQPKPKKPRGRANSAGPPAESAPPEKTLHVSSDTALNRLEISAEPAAPMAPVDALSTVRELVALQDIKLRMAKLAARPDYLESSEKLAEYDRLSTDYSKRQPIAWEAARAAIKAAPAAPLLSERDPSRPSEQQGLFRKFDVRRTDGSDQPGSKHHGCRYFVLDVDHDAYASAALTAYAAVCETTHPELARDLREKWSTSAVQAASQEKAEPATYSDLRRHPFGAERRGDWIVIAVSLDTLRHATENCPDLEYYPESGGDFVRPVVTDIGTFANEFVGALNNESEDGSTLVTRVFDAAIERAVEDGAEGVEVDEAAAELRRQGLEGSPQGESQ